MPRDPSYSEERVAELLGELRPAPAAWVRAAQELPSLRRTLDDIVFLAETDAEFQRALVDDLESALRAKGYEASPRLIEELRTRLD
jgi:hypothetical protein